VTRVNKPSNKMVTPILAPPTLERSAMPKAGMARARFPGKLAARFQQDERGSTAIMFALLITPVMFLTGMAVDFSRMVTVKTRMQTAIDAASLAGVRAQQATGANSTTYQTTATTYYNAITQSLPYVVTTKLNTPTVAATTNKYSWTAETWVRTPFLSVAQIIANGPAEAGAPAGCTGSKWKCQKVVTAASVLATSGGNNTGYSIETSFMLDITGSMRGQKLTDLKTATNNAIDILVWSDQSVQTSRVAISPFAEDVRMPTVQAYEAATGRTAVNATKQVYGYNFGANANNLCVSERQGADRYLDTAPSASSRPVAVWDYINNNGVSSANCNVPAASAVQPLTSDKIVLHNLVNGLDDAGYTAGHIGTAWAWYMLSPNFNALWATANQAKPYDTNYNINTKVGDPTKVKLKKIAVLMTDGDYNTQYTSQGILTSYFGEAAANDTATNQANALCTNMKAKGIEVYTVGFQVSNAAKTMLTNCATDASHFYDATTGDSLNMAFKDIALKISQIRVSG
jgi:Putative Flp pilus-assembly TadE/G-like